MEPATKELTLEESLTEVMRELPQKTRDYIARSAYKTVTQELVTKYHLDGEKKEILNREVLLLLMGVEHPVEVVEALVEEAKLDEGTVGAIVQEVDKQILTPLNNKQSSTATTSPRVAPAAQAPLPRYNFNAPPLQSPRYVRAEEDIVAFKAAPLPPKVTMPTAKPTVVPTTPATSVAAKAPEIKPQAPEPKAPAEIVPKMEALPIGEEEAKVALPAPSAPALPPQPSLAPSTPAPAAPVPAEPKLRMADPATPPPPKAFKTPPVPVRPPTADDPYREPIDVN